MPRLAVRPVTAQNWDDFVRLFEARGSPHYCWCTPYRFRDSPKMSKANKKAGMQALVDNGTPIGVLAYDGEDPIGWCSVAPRESYTKLERSRTMPRETPADVSTWTVLCFFVVRSHREQGVAHALLRGALRHARAAGAKVVEGYPFDSAGVTATHHGHSRAFNSAGFKQGGRRWSRSIGRR